MVVTAPNPIHGTSAPTSSWSTVNLAEAVPGPVTPLGWSVWAPAGERGGRVPFYAMGAIPKAMLAVPERSEDRILNVFYGRVALRVDFMCQMGDRVPGTSGEALGKQVFGFVPEGYVSRPSRRRYPVIAVKFPPTFLRVPALIRQARVVLKLAGRYLPLRGVGKVAFLQSLDVARAAARHIGTLLAGDGVLAEPEDVFYLTAPEILGPPPANARDLVAERREIRDSYRKLRLPTFWTGEPVYEVIEDIIDDAAGALAAGRLSGCGVSPGIVEGPARVVTDPALADMEPGDILVAHTTDPSWPSLMFMANALVVDIGGQLSHAAVVARELSIPCVMNTLDGTRRLHDGDRLRVDGGAGTVEILNRSGG